MSVPDLAPLGPARCRALLASVPLGRLGFVRDGRPAIRPVNFTVASDAIWLRAGRNSWADRLDGQPVTFEADAYDPAGHTGWSVIVTGVAHVVRDPEQVRRYEALIDPWVNLLRDHVIRIETEVVTGLELIGENDESDADLDERAL